jgi:hypothetical protein
MTDKKQRLEAQMAQVKAELLGERPERAKKPRNTVIAHAKAAENKDPIGLAPKPNRNKLPEGTSIRKELTFNTYIAQIEEPRSFLNLLPETMKEAVTTIPQDLIELDEDTLLVRLENDYKYKPTASVEAMRNNFWMEFDRVAVTRNEVMNQSNIYLGVVSREHFHNMLRTGGHVLAYILCRPPEYEAVMRGLLNLSTRKIRDVLNIPLQKADGSVQDPKIIELVLKAAAMVDLRAKGGYVQRSETKNLTMMKQETTSYTTVFNAASSNKSPDIASLTADIDAKIAALEKEMSAVPGIAYQPPEPTEAAPAEEYADFREKGDIV